FVVLTLLGGAGILIYLAAALVIPDEGKAESFAAQALRERRDHPWKLIGLGLVAIGGAVLLSHTTLWPQGDAAWTLVLLAGLAILWGQRRGPRADGRPRRVGRWIGLSALAAVVLVLAAGAAFATWADVTLGAAVGARACA